MNTGLSWHKLDNSAMIYPMLMTNDKQNIFRITYMMDSDVNPSFLLSAINTAFDRFPSFKVKLKKGLFWHYFATNEKPFKVFELGDIQLEKINFRRNNDYCFRISYYNKLIVGDFFHVLCDGTGGSEFMKCVLYYYLLLEKKNIVNNGEILTKDVPIDTREYEDSFSANYIPTKLKDLKIKSLTGKAAYHIEGDLINKAYGSNLIHLIYNSKDVISLAKSKAATVTELLGGVFCLALYNAQIKDEKVDTKPFQIMCPINLRKMFNSISLKNFSLFSRVEVPTNDGLTLEFAMKCFHDSLLRDVNKDLMQAKINTTVKSEKFVPFRFLPLVLKQAIFSFSNLFVGKSNKTATVSNIGVAKLSEGMDSVKNISYSISVNKKTPISMTIGSLNNDMCITFTSILKSSKIEEEFVKIMNDFGINCKVMSNSVEANYEM